MKNTKGITLIALIITIIVMLILVAVSISVALNTGLFKSAGDATKNWKSAQDTEANVGSEIKIGDKTYSSIEDYVEGKEKLPEDAGKRFTETKEYSDGTKTAWIPAGFTVSGIRGETAIDEGLVIYDIPAGEDIDWTNPDSVKTAYNQFVWIPIEVNKNKDTETSIASFRRNVWQDNARVIDNTQSTTSFPDSSYTWSNFTEPYSYNDDDIDEQTGIKLQIAELTKSVYNYGGFWMGRYEAGVKPIKNEETGEITETPRTNSHNSQDDPFVVQQDKYPYNHVRCLWAKTGVEGAVDLCNELYNDSNYGVKSMLCTGAAWDCMLDFIKDASHDVTNSTSWGNYCDSETYKIKRGRFTDNGTWNTADPINGSEIKKDSMSLLTTGATDRNLAKNLYDIAGNCTEWTTEAETESSRVVRGRRFYL